ncbi:MAG: hypothetical protein RLZZ249_720 [Actinomycetota bacterium]
MQPYYSVMQISVEVLIDAPVEKVWNAYVTPEDITQWNFASDDWCCPSSVVDLRVGGKFSSRMEARDGSQGFDFEGVYTEIVEHELLSYAFGDRSATVKFVQEPTGVRVRVEFDTEDINSAEMQRAGWQSILNNFAAHVSGV